MQQQQDSRQPRSNEDQHKRRPGVLKVLQGVLAGAFGVQSGKGLQEDFTSHSPWPYIIAGVLFTLGFIGLLALVVGWVLSGYS